MKSSTKKSRNSLITILILAIVILAAGWYYMNSQKTSVEVISDKDGYFTSDFPVVTVHLNNADNADSGELRVSYDDVVLKLDNFDTTTGVTLKELKNTLVLELSENYFDENISDVAVLTFEIIQPGNTEVKVDKATLSGSKGDIKVEEMINAQFDAGIASAPVPADKGRAGAMPGTN